MDASRLNRHVAQVVRHVATQLKAERHVDALLPWLDQAIALETRGRGNANAHLSKCTHPLPTPVPCAHLE